MPVDATAIGLKVSADLITRTLPGGVGRARAWLKGNEILVLGQARAGKTSFVDYLQYGLLEVEEDTAKTYDLYKTASFNMKMGRDSSLQLNFRRVVDVAGQVGPIEHANIARRRKAHAIILITDLATPLSGAEHDAAGTWLATFCTHLDEHLRNSKRMKSKLKALIVVMNKQDKASSSTATNRKAAFRKILKKHLAYSFGHRAENIPILPCVLVETKYKTRLADAVVLSMAKALAKSSNA